MTGTPSYFDEEFEMASNSRAFASRDEGCCDRTGEVLIYCDVACSPKPKADNTAIQPASTTRSFRAVNTHPWRTCKLLSNEVMSHKVLRLDSVSAALSASGPCMSYAACACHYLR